MVTLNLDDANYPASLVVFDRITSANANFKKTWLLHSIQEPTVDANTITILRDEGDYAGKLVTESILPTNPTITKIGGTGYQFWVDWIDDSNNFMVIPSNSDDEPGAWRVEVVPSVNEVDNVFLHVMTVMDDDEPNGPVVQTIVDGNNIVTGVRLLDRAVVFGKQSEFLSRVSFKVPGSGTAKILVCDLLPGLWSVSRGGESIAGAIEATEDGRCIYFEGPTGLDEEYLLTFSSADFDDDWDVDLADLRFMVGQWLSSTPQVHPVTGRSPDLYSDGTVNFKDFSLFGQRWLEGTDMPEPVAFYKFEGNYNNEMGGAAGTAYGNATTVYNAARGSNVLSLDGSGDYVDFGNTAVAGIDREITVTAWIKTSSLGGSNTIVAKCYAWQIHGNSDVLRFSNTGTPADSLDGTTDVADGTWHHIAAVYNGTTKYVYVDGDLENSVGWSQDLSTWDTYGFAAGAMIKTGFVGFPKFFFDGMIDDVRVYDSALSPDQIETLAGQ